jgi:CRISPR-associated Cas5-like protein
MYRNELGYIKRNIQLDNFEEFDGPAVSALGMQTWNLSNVRKGQSSDGWKNLLARDKGRKKIQFDNFCHGYFRDQIKLHTLLFSWTLKAIEDSSSSYPFPTLSGVGTTCFSLCCDTIRQLFLRPAACLTSTLFETGVDVNDCKCSRDQRLSLLKHGGARDNIFWLPILWLTEDVA